MQIEEEEEEEEEELIEQEKGLIDTEREFPLLEILRLKMHSLESLESPGWFRDWYPYVSFSFAFYCFYRFKVA